MSYAKGMARPTRFQYPGAIYHVMARGDGGKVVFETDDDRKAFVFRLAQVCESHGWRIHAWVLMGNHFHLLLETPQANLVSGMKYLMGTFSQGWNRARLRRGHVFQGRYKAVPVNGTDADAYYFRIVADYIHLNPARAGLAGGRNGPLVGYKWSSLPSHQKGNGPDWLVMERVLRAFELGATGYLVKNSWFGNYPQAVLQVANGGASITPSLARRLLQRYDKKPASDPQVSLSTTDRLSSRESEVLRMVAGGYTSVEIGVQLQISTMTVNTHIKNIYRKLQVRSRAQAVRFASLRGWF